MDAETTIRQIQMDGYNEGAEDWYRKAWDDVADLLDEAAADRWTKRDLLDTLWADCRKYADRVPASTRTGERDV